MKLIKLFKFIDRHLNKAPFWASMLFVYPVPAAISETCPLLTSVIVSIYLLPFALLWWGYTLKWNEEEDDQPH